MKTDASLLKFHCGVEVPADELLALLFLAFFFFGAGVGGLSSTMILLGGCWTTAAACARWAAAMRLSAFDAICWR